jgi:hypothetical protein
VCLYKPNGCSNGNAASTSINLNDFVVSTVLLNYVPSFVVLYEVESLAFLIGRECI